MQKQGESGSYLSVLTLFNKRAFSIPDSFTDAIISYSHSLGVTDDSSRLDTLMHNSLNDGVSFQFLGVIRESDLGFTPEGWFFIREEPPPGLLKHQDSESGKIVSKVYVTLLQKDSGWRMPRKTNGNLDRGSVLPEGVLPLLVGGTPLDWNRKLVWWKYKI